MSLGAFVLRAVTTLLVGDSGFVAIKCREREGGEKGGRFHHRTTVPLSNDCITDSIHSSFFGLWKFGVA